MHWSSQAKETSAAKSGTPMLKRRPSWQAKFEGAEETQQAINSAGAAAAKHTANMEKSCVASLESRLPWS